VKLNLAYLGLYARSLDDECAYVEAVHASKIKYAVSEIK